MGSKVFAAYVDIDITATFDFRGCHAPSLEELNKAIIKEVREALQIDKQPPREWDIKIYYNRLAEVRKEIFADAIAIVTHRTMNRSPMYI